MAASVEIAHRPRSKWAAVPFDRRAEVLRKVAALIRPERAALIWNIRECGSISTKGRVDPGSLYERGADGRRRTLLTVGLSLDHARPHELHRQHLSAWWG